ncbi:transcriptional regulator [Sphaerisporangium album]|nr:transcriptional regulator [Sphaerisporangium album]
MAKEIVEHADALGVRMPERNSLIRSIKGWEAGEHRPRHPYPMLYARVFGTDEEALFGDPLEPSYRSPAEVLAAVMPEHDLLGPESDAHGRRRIDMGTVTDLSGRVHGLRLADDVLGGDDLIGPAFRELDAAVRLYRENTHDETVGRALLGIIGEYAQIAGWIASDAGQEHQAVQSYRLGISAAREAGDHTLESNILGSLAYLVANTGDPREGAELALTSLDALKPWSPARARALAWDRVAWAHAREGNAQAAIRSLGESETALAGEYGQEPPSYLYWVNAGELQIMEARVFTELRRPLRAVPLLTKVLDRYDAAHARELSLYLSWLAVALIDANEPEEAARTARRMLDLCADIASDRMTQRVRIVLQRLNVYQDVPEVRAVLTGYPFTA